jgi:hypothetical protein
MKRHTSQTRAAAEILGIQVLAHFAEEPERLNGFLSATGFTVDGIRAAAHQPDFLAGVLEHMLGDERMLIAFAQSAGIDPGDVARACTVLGGRWERDVP